ncbi:MAG: HEAT repeat domain-containing protein, partial [Myxococcales bacterium]|nr:HEAT repeat domain-containing protein [Myxococcales bacterium]
SAVTVAAAGTVAGCTDEQDPQTHVDRLSDPIKRTPAVKRLLQFYEDAMTRDDKNREGPAVKPLLDTVVPPLVELANSGELDSATQGDVLAFLADTRDVRALPALTKALENYKPDDKRAEEYDTKIGDVVRNLGEMQREEKLKDQPDVKKALFAIFRNLEAATPKAQNRSFFRTLNNVLVRISDPSWEDELISMLQKPIKSAKQKALKDLTNQVYWQVTAAEILGELRSKKAVEPLIKVVLSPFKANVATTAINALIKIGQPALDAAVKLMNGEDDALKTYAFEEAKRATEDRGDKFEKKEKEAAENAYLNNGIIIVGNIGTQAALEPMLAAIDKGDAITKSLVAAELYKLPVSDQAKDKFKEVYSSVGVTDKIPPDDYAKEALLNSAASFFDKDLNGWLLADGLELKGGADDVRSVQATILTIGIKAADEGQWTYVDQLKAKALPEIKTKADKYYFKDAKKPKEEGPFTEKELVDKILALEVEQGTIRADKEGSKHEPMEDTQNFAMALSQAQYLRAIKNGKEILDECKSDVACYLKAINDPKNNQRETATKGEKAAYMAALLGGDDVKMKLVEMLPKVRNPGVTEIILYAVLNKSPKGDPAVEKKLQDYVDEAADSRDAEKIDETKGYKQIIYRLQDRKS